MKFGSLFSGIGGFDLGFERVGMTCAWQAERDKYALQVLNKHWPAVRKYEDVRDVGRDAEAIDLVCGGFPCQDLSVAGKRAGLAGERSGLWFEFARIIDELRPRWVVIENVPGLLSSNKGRDMAILLGGLAQLGYGWAYRVLDSQYHGVAQRRRRVFIVGYFGDARVAAKVLFEPESRDWDSAPRREKGQGYSFSSKPSAKARSLGGAWGVTPPLRTEEVPAYLAPEVAIPVIGSGKDCAGSVLANYGTKWGLGDQEAFRGEHHVIEQRTVNVRGGKEGGGKGYLESESGQSIALPVGVRRLTPIECERLQGFPENFTSLDGRMSDTQRYKMMGNAVTVNVIEWIGKRIMDVDSQ